MPNIALLSTALSGLLAAAAQTPSVQPVPTLSIRYLPSASDSSRPVLNVHVEIAPGWHINSDRPLDEFLVPTSVEAKAEGLDFGAPQFPAPQRVRSDAMGGDMLLFSGAFDVSIPVRAGKSPPPVASSQKTWPRTRVTLRYQACDHSTCFPPKEVTVGN